MRICRDGVCPWGVLSQKFAGCIIFWLCLFCGWVLSRCLKFNWSCLMTSGVGMVGLFLTHWCHKHFRKSKNIADKSSTGPSRFEPAGHKHFWCGLVLLPKTVLWWNQERKQGKRSGKLPRVVTLGARKRNRRIRVFILWGPGTISFCVTLSGSATAVITAYSAWSEWKMQKNTWNVDETWEHTHKDA